MSSSPSQCSVEGVSKAQEGVCVRFTQADGTTEERTVSKLLVAVGRKSRTDGIGLEQTAVELDRGTIVVDE